MANSELTLHKTLEKIDTFCPVKIIFNGVILYNDYDSDVEIEDGVWGENDIPLNVIPNRIWQFDKYIVTSVNIEIVEFHHAIITMQGEYKED